MNTTKLTSAVEQYLTDLRRIRASGGATSERSYYPPLTNLLNAIGGMLKPKVFCVGELAEQGAGHPDLGLYAARRIGVTEQIFYRWRSQYGGLRIDQARRLKRLESENSRLKRAVADLTLDNQFLRKASEGSF